MTRTPMWSKQKHPKTGRSWELDRRKKFRSASTADPNRRPAPHSRKQCYVRPHTRDGHPVRGHYRNI